MKANNQVSNIAKGMGIGMAVGGAIGIAGGAMRHPRYQRTAKKGFNKVMKTVTSVLDAIA